MNNVQIGDRWNDLKLNRQEHEHLVAVVKLTNNYTHEYFYWPTKCVWTFMRELTQQLKSNSYTRFERLQKLYYYVPDFHVELINPMHPLPKDFKYSEDFADCAELLLQQARERYTQLIRADRDDPLNIIGWYSKWAYRSYVVVGEEAARPELPADWHVARQHGMSVQEYRQLFEDIRQRRAEREAQLLEMVEKGS